LPITPRLRNLRLQISDLKDKFILKDKFVLKEKFVLKDKPALRSFAREVSLLGGRWPGTALVRKLCDLCVSASSAFFYDRP